MNSALVLLFAILALVSSEWLAPLDLTNQERGTHFELQYNTRCGPWVYHWDTLGMYVNDFFGTDSRTQLHFPFTGENRSNFYVYDAACTSDYTLIWVINIYSGPSGDDEDFFFVYDPYADEVTLLHREDYDEGYWAVGAGWDTAFLQADESLYTVDFDTWTLNGPFVNGDWDGDTWTDIMVYRVEDMDYGVVTRSIDNVNIVVVVGIDGIEAEFALNATQFTGNDYNNDQSYGSWYIFKSENGASFVDFSDFWNPVPYFIAIPNFREARSSWAVDGYFYAFTSTPEVVIFDLATWESTTQTVLGDAYDSFRPDEGDEMLVALYSDVSLSGAIFCAAGECVEVNTGLNGRSVYASNAAGIAIHLIDGNFTGLDAEGNMLFNIPYETDNTPWTGYGQSLGLFWYSELDLSLARLVYHDGNTILSQYLLEVCVPGSGFYGPNCVPCECVYGECADGAEFDGACACIDNVLGDLCDECDADHFGDADPVCASPCTCANGDCDSGRWGTGVCINGTCTGNFMGENCDTCTNFWDGDNCDECPAWYSGADCDTCAENREGDMCDTCSGNWSGDDCLTCPPEWDGDNCDTCAENREGDDCMTCSSGFTLSGDTCVAESSSSLIAMAVVALIAVFF